MQVLLDVGTPLLGVTQGLCGDSDLDAGNDVAHVSDTFWPTVDHERSGVPCAVGAKTTSWRR